MLKRTLPLLCFLIIVLPTTFAGNLGTLGRQRSMAGPKDYSGFNAKLMPALFWNNLGIELEFAPNYHFSFGIRGEYKFSSLSTRRDDYKIRKEDYLRDGYLVEVFARYFLKKEAPQGIYFQAFGTYSNIVYFDGNVRAYTLHNNWKELTAFQFPNFIEAPKEYGGGIGAGYQTIVIPERIIANVSLNVQANFDQQNDIFLNFFVTPSLGYMF